MRVATYKPYLALTSFFLVPQVWAQTCESFGVDFVDQGTYFQNSLSTDNFTFVSRFEGQYSSHVIMAYAQSLQTGCQNGIANNLLVDPNGDEYICSNTPLQPDDAPELSTWYVCTYVILAPS